MSASIELKITKFPPVGPGLVSSIEHVMGAPSGDPNVEPGSGKDRLKVKKGGANLAFNVIDGTAEKRTYDTIGIAFSREVGGVPKEPVEWTQDPHSKTPRTFTGVKCSGNRVSFDDNVPPSGGAPQSYKCWIFVLRDDGTVGVIDPYIENEH